MSKIYITSCEHGANAWTGNCDSLLKLADLAEVKRHEIVDDPAIADVILITDLRDRDYFVSLREHPLIRRYNGKCYAYSELDWPLRLLHGIYPGMRQSSLNLNRFRSSSYLTRYSEWRNPFVSDRHDTSEKDILFSFMGRNSSAVRGRLLGSSFGREDIVIEDTSSYHNWTRHDVARTEAQQRYADIMNRSRFVLCPAGAGPSTIRLFEAMEMQTVPVILSDRWLAPRGPDWRSLAIFVPEKNVGQLPSILERYDDRWKTMAELARKNWEQWFAPSKQFNFIADNIDSIRRSSCVSEALFIRWGWPVMLFQKKYVTPRRWFFAARAQFDRRVVHSS